MTVRQNVNTWGRWSLGVWVLSLGLTCASVAQEQSQPSLRRSALEVDRRLQQPVSLPPGQTVGADGVAVPWRGTVEELLQLVRRRNPVPLAAQRTITRERLVIAHPGKGPVSDAGTLLQAMGVCVNARWNPVQQGWVITDIPELASLFTLDQDSFDEQFHALLGRTVHPGELTPAQF